MRFRVTNDSLITFDLRDTKLKQTIYTFKDKQIAIDMCSILNDLVESYQQQVDELSAFRYSTDNDVLVKLNDVKNIIGGSNGREM